MAPVTAKSNFKYLNGNNKYQIVTRIGSARNLVIQYPVATVVQNVLSRLFFALDLAKVFAGLRNGLVNCRNRLIILNFIWLLVTMRVT